MSRKPPHQYRPPLEGEKAFQVCLDVYKSASATAAHVLVRHNHGGRLWVCDLEDLAAWPLDVAIAEEALSVVDASLSSWLHHNGGLQGVLF